LPDREVICPKVGKKYCCGTCESACGKSRYIRVAGMKRLEKLRSHKAHGNSRVSLPTRFEARTGKEENEDATRQPVSDAQ
jgi:hypothetical protein